jgi:hypothetical protein
MRRVASFACAAMAALALPEAVLAQTSSRCNPLTTSELNPIPGSGSGSGSFDPALLL